MKTNKGITKIDGFTLTGLMFSSIAVTAVLFGPLASIKVAGQDAWIALIIVCLGGAYLVYILYYLSNLFPGQTLIEYLPLIVGKTAGKIIGLGYILFFFYLTASVTREALALLYGTGVFTLTPEIVIIALLIVATTYGAASGIEVIGRTLNIYWIVIAIIYITFICICIPSMQFNALFPIGEAGFKTILKSSMLPHCYRGELFLLAMLLPYCRSSREGFIAGQIVNLLIAVFIIVTIIACVTVMGADTSARSLYAPFFLADFIQPVGIKILLVGIWIIAFWGKIALLQFIITNGISQWLGLKQPGAIITPIAILVLVFSLTFYKNATDVFESIPLTFPGSALFFEYLIPTLLVIVIIIQKKVMQQSKE